MLFYLKNLLLLGNLLVSFACTGQISEAEYDGLHNIFLETAGQNWNYRPGSPPFTRWSFPNSLSVPCTDKWQGLNCTGSGGNCLIIGLDLSSMNLTGPLPKGLQNLSSVETVDLSSNQLFGTINLSYFSSSVVDLNLNSNWIEGNIPPFTEGWVKLNSLNFSRNALNGTIPSSIISLTNLQFLDLHGNRLSGTIGSSYLPTSIISLSLSMNKFKGDLPSLQGNDHLTFLDLSMNDFSGMIPTSIYSLTKLQGLFLYGNHLTGVIQSSIGRLIMVQQLDIGFNKLSGPIPSDIGNMTSLTYLDLQLNYLKGSIPTTIGNLANLKILSLSLDCLHGTIPTEMGNLKELAALDLFGNFITGSLPSELGQLQKMIIISLSTNRLSAQLPSDLRLMANLKYLYVSVNYFSGIFPSELGQLPLTVFDADWNLFDGTLPQSFSNLTKLQRIALGHNLLTQEVSSSILNSINISDIVLGRNYFSGYLPLIPLSPNLLQIEFNNNLFSGPYPFKCANFESILEIHVGNNLLNGSLPNDFEHCTHLAAFTTSDNFFTGELPMSLTSLTTLQVIRIDNNFFCGSLPDLTNSSATLKVLNANQNNFSPSPFPKWLEQLKNISSLDLNYCAFTGPIPEFVGNLLLLQSLDLSFNSLTGLIPSSLPLLSRLQYLNVESNHLKGTIPNGIGRLKLMNYLNLGNNLLTGGISEELFCNSTSLKAIYLSKNKLSGSLPQCPKYKLNNVSDIQGFIAARSLQQLDLSSNRFTGHLKHIFSKKTFPFLRIIDLSNNAFSGSLPYSLFSLPSIDSLALYSNCFSGSLPNSICEGNYTTTLILDGLSTAPHCCKPSWKPYINAVFPGWLMKGSIPSCVWSLPKLQTLHLSGNGLTGTLGEISPNSSLTSISIASNKLTGPIPTSFQTWGRFVQLDMSANHLDGVLDKDFRVNPNQTTLNLLDNRLSGTIPASIIDAQYVNVLEGNLFGCNTGVPNADPNQGSFQCGSRAWNVSLLTWAIALILSAAIGIKVSKKTLQLVKPINKVFYTGLNLTRQAVLLSCVLTAFICMVANSVYVALKSGSDASLYSTHTYQYTYIVSAAYLKGRIPALLFESLIIITVSLSILVMSRAKMSASYSKQSEDQQERTSHPVIMVMIHTFNAVVVLAINVSYVYFVASGKKKINLSVFQIALGGFKSVWSLVAIPQLSALIDRSNFHRLMLTLFCIIGGPVVASLFSSPSCFLNIIPGEKTISSSFEVSAFICEELIPLICTPSKCTLTNISSICFFSPHKTTVETSLKPGWQYSYQCSADLIRNFSPVLLSSAIISGIIIPWCIVIVFEYEVFRQRVSPTILSAIDPILHEESLNLMRASMYSTTTNSIDLRPSGSDLEIDGCDTSAKVLVKNSASNVRLLMNLLLLATFGLVNPLLAFAIGVDSVANIFLLLYFIRRHMVANNIDVRHIQIISATKSIKGFKVPLIIIGCVCLLFWSVFLVDIIGEWKDGYLAAAFLVVHFCILCALGYICQRVWIALVKDSETRFEATLSRMPSRGRINSVGMVLQTLRSLSFRNGNNNNPVVDRARGPASTYEGHDCSLNGKY